MSRQQQQPPPPPPAQQQSEAGQSAGSMKRFGGAPQAISFGTLMPMLLPTLQAEQGSKLLALYQKLRRTEITKEDFLRATRLLVGDQLLVQTVKQMQLKQQQLQTQKQVSQPEQQQQQHPHPFPQHPVQQQHHLNQMTPEQHSLHQPPLQVQELHDHSQLAGSHQQELMQIHSSQQQQQQQQSNLEAKQITPLQPQNSHLSSASVHLQPNRQVEQYPEHQAQQSNQHTSCTLNLQQHEAGKLMPISTSAVTTNSNAQLSSAAPQSIHSSVADITMITAPTSVSIPGNPTQMPAMIPASQVRTPPKKVLIEPRKFAETTPVMQPPSKKQKLSGGILDQSIDQLNDVTAVSGVNLKEEEEQLLTGPKEESRTTQMMRRFVQEEEGQLFLERGPLRSKVAAIAAKFGVKIVGEDVERCLSMSTEERLRNMLYKLKRLSSQRCDEEKEAHNITITSDLQRKLSLIRKKAKEEQDKKQAEESERLRKLNEKKDKGSSQESVKEEPRAKQQKANKEEDEKMRAKAANVAARVAAGVDDMLIKWQMMAEQGRQKREEESVDGGSDSQTVPSNGSVRSKEVDRKYTTGDAGQRVRSNAAGSTSLAVAGFAAARGLAKRPHTTQVMKVGHAITVKDVISFLETEPQMSKSNLLYHLHDRSLTSSQAINAGGNSCLP